MNAMNWLPQLIINAFPLDGTSGAFTGNPAAVVLSQKALKAARMQAIAAQNNLAETAFLAPYSSPEADYSLRWFTPAVEVPLCGHATLASAHALQQHFGFEAAEIRFATQQSGILIAKNVGEAIELNLPAHRQSPCKIGAEITALGLPVEAAFDGAFLMLVLDSATAVAAYQPDREAILAFGKEVIITAHGSGDFAQYDCVSRMFAPHLGIDEDPVTGSAHCQLAPYWADVLGKSILKAAQIGARPGVLEIEPFKDRVLLRGAAQTYGRGEIYA